MPRGAQTVLFVGLGLLVTLAAAAYWLFFVPHFTDQKLGGAWELRQAQSLTIGSGHPPYFLQRVHGRERATVAQDPFPYRYLGDDCMLFTSWGHGEFQVQAACGDRPPILVTRVERAVSLQDVERDPATLNDKPYSWADLKQHALRGQAF